MDQNKLSNNEELVLRLLYSGKLDSTTIPEIFFGTTEKDTLIRLNLLELTGEGKYILTTKARETIETGGFIVKYPLHNEEGVVMNFVDILNSYSKEALKALGLSIINTESYKRWGKFNNINLSAALKETIQYYNSFGHPLSRIDNYRDEILEAESTYEKALIVELSKIEPFKLVKPVPLGVHANGNTINLIELISPNTGIIKQGTLKMSVRFSDPQYKLTTYMMHQLLHQYYVVKSKAAKAAIVEQK